MTEVTRIIISYHLLLQCTNQMHQKKNLGQGNKPKFKLNIRKHSLFYCQQNLFSLGIKALLYEFKICWNKFQRMPSFSNCSSIRSPGCFMICPEQSTCHELDILLQWTCWLASKILSIKQHQNDNWFGDISFSQPKQLILVLSQDILFTMLLLENQLFAVYWSGKEKTWEL